MSTSAKGNVILETIGLTKDFGGLRAVDSANFRVKRGELISIIGPNGAGKTTFFNLLSGHLTPTSGQILYQGQDVTDVPNYRRTRLGIGRSFQITNVFPNLTAFENIRIACQAKKSCFDLWSSALKNKDLNHKANRILSMVGLEGKSDLPANTLAYGDQRYLEIGIALATDPQLLLLDEPTAGMSPEESSYSARFIRGLLKHVDIVLVEHDMEVVMSISDEVACMHAGRVIACQSPDEIKKNPEVQKCYFRE